MTWFYILGMSGNILPFVIAQISGIPYFATVFSVQHSLQICFYL